jgi:hypothetical protein
VKTCPDCNGDGVIEKGTDDERQCPTCGGSGFVPDDDEDEEVIRAARLAILPVPCYQRAIPGGWMLNRSLIFAAVILFTATLMNHAPAVWRGPPQMLVALDGETRDWVQALKNKFGGGCCDTADGFPVEVDGWDMAGTVDDTLAITELDARYARSGYRVRLTDGKWQTCRIAR